ncbi:MAG TPA: SDR family NAD(P)-dependent oxidoreductase [Rhodoferax sp.]|nr:SDR family NAD(P)-dependent oxidoreductase [Rhodoferax sp.]HPW85398.1 SDR family NAD(P)-dependent oxidoreductase [Rhodoferax sp.]HQC85664.1 SDR family NAD(P)-dependent oxidoreductase [Rhodoferax sp.]
MDIRNKVAIVTGGASGIGRSIARRFAADGARGVVVADVNLEHAQAVADEIKGIAVRCDVSKEADIQALVATTRQHYGQVDAYISNAGILGRMGGLDLEDTLWDAMWNIHGMAHVWAARAVVPEMVARGEGFFMVTASAAGLLTIVESAPYAVTKHAAVAFAEWLRIAYGRKGVQVACLCPQSVQTNMISGTDGGSAAVNGILAPEVVAQEVVSTMDNGKFLVLPHPEVAQYFRNKGQDYERWIGGMQKMYARHNG